MQTLPRGDRTSPAGRGQPFGHDPLTSCSHPRNTEDFFLQGLTQDIAALLRFSRLRSGRPGVPLPRAPRARPAGPVTHERGAGSHTPRRPARADPRRLSRVRPPGVPPGSPPHEHWTPSAHPRAGVHPHSHRSRPARLPRGRAGPGGRGDRGPRLPARRPRRHPAPPTDRTCGKESCVWIGTFTGADGGVTARNVGLKDAVRVRRGDPAPGTTAGVRLAKDAETACTADYGRRAPVVKGAALGLVGLAIATGLFLMLRHYRTALARP